MARGLRVFDGETAKSVFGRSRVTAEEVKDYVEEIIESESSGIARDYAMSFISDVDFQEIADHLNEIEDNDDDEVDDE